MPGREFASSLMNEFSFRDLSIPGSVQSIQVQVKKAQVHLSGPRKPRPSNKLYFLIPFEGMGLGHTLVQYSIKEWSSYIFYCILSMQFLGLLNEYIMSKVVRWEIFTRRAWAPVHVKEAPLGQRPGPPCLPGGGEEVVSMTDTKGRRSQTRRAQHLHLLYVCVGGVQCPWGHTSHSAPDGGSVMVKGAPQRILCSSGAPGPGSVTMSDSGMQARETHNCSPPHLSRTLPRLSRE